MLQFVQPAHPPVDVGQTIHYTVRYRNAGTETQHGVRLALTGYGVELASERSTWATCAPGAEVQATFDGQVTGAGPEGHRGRRSMACCTMRRIRTARRWTGSGMAHRVDQGPPEALSLSRLGSTVGPGLAALGGFANDESGVRSVEVEITGPNGTRTITCPVERPAEGRWGCAWDVGGAGLPDGTQFTLRARATDLLGTPASGAARGRCGWMPGRRRCR